MSDAIPTIVTWDLKDKTVCFFLKQGETVELENIIDVEVYPKTESREKEKVWVIELI